MIEGGSVRGGWSAPFSSLRSRRDFSRTGSSPHDTNTDTNGIHLVAQVALASKTNTKLSPDYPGKD